MMGMLGPLIIQGLGRSPYDEVVQGEGPEDPRGPQQLYDDRGRPINPETKRINRDVIRSHNEVMMVIGVAEPENGIAEAQLEAAHNHRAYEDRIGRRLLLTGGVLETAAIWGVNGMRQRILLFKPYSQTTFYGMFQLAWHEQPLSSFILGGLPSFLASTMLEQLAVPEYKKYPVLQYATTYIRLHLAIYTFFQRAGIIPFDRLLPNWRFFVPGTSMSPILIPPIPASFRPRSLLQWLGAFAVGTAPFVGFYLYTKLYSFVTRTLRFKIHRLLPRPHNSTKWRQLREPSFSRPPDPVPIEQRIEEALEPMSSTPTTTTRTPNGPPRRQSAVSLAGSGTAPGPAAAGLDDFASDDEETEVPSATLISFDVEATEPTPEPSSNPSGGADTTTATTGGVGNGDATPGIWSAELRPNITDSNRPGGPGSGGAQQEPTYRENVLTRLPAVLATDVLAITPTRLFMTPFAAAVWLSLAKPYMVRAGMGLEQVVDGVGWWWGLSSGRSLANFLGTELLLAVMHSECWAVMLALAEWFRYSEEEWNEREGVGREEVE